MAAFKDKKLRRLFEEGGQLAGADAEDIGLAIALCRQLLARALERARMVAEQRDVILDPSPGKDDGSED